MKSLATLVLVVLFHGAAAQTWCPPGATWYYTDSSLVSGNAGYRVLEYVQDTTIDGQVAQQLSNTWYRLIAGILDPLISFKLHTYQDGSVVYCRTEINQDWDTLYWFNAGIGDHWHFAQFSDTDPCNRLIIVDTGTVTMAGMALHFLDYEMDSAGVTISHRITERLGDSNSYWPQPMCGNFNEVKRGLRCYSDNDLGMISTGIVPACDYTTSIAESLDVPVLSVYPLPGRDHVTVVLPPGVHRIEVIGTGGRLIHAALVISGAQLDTSAWPVGSYVMRFPDLGRNMTWVKE
jgi:hypothetical protein